MSDPIEYVELTESAADRERFRQIAQQTAISLGAKSDGFHVITERAEGPDLDDLVRLIRYLREHGIQHRTDTIGHPLDPDHHGHLTVRWWSVDETAFSPVNVAHCAIESNAAYSGHFVGPDGTVYDANREAL